MGMDSQWNDIDRGKLKKSEKILSQYDLSTTNLTWTDPGMNLGLRVERLVTNHLSHQTLYLVRIKEKVK
jgi:hypothetical protein